ncbi:MAG: hypothetical protein WC869_00885 [Phycisphaerae bacterium]|jgi:hypothetical protein
MLSLDYLVVQQFLAIEALGMQGARHGDPADPLFLQVAVTHADDIKNVVETVIARRDTRQKLWRAACGKWAFRIDPRLYQDGITYTVHFKFSMTPNNTNVVRQSFVWAAPMAKASMPGQCLVYGGMKDMLGLPESGGRFVAETYLDFITLNQRTGLEDIVADIFGNWYVSLPKGQLVRLVFGEGATLVKIPADRDTADYLSLERFQPQDLVRRDRFGYPTPTTGV